MSKQSTASEPRTDAGGQAPDAETDAEELLIEEISIDGMCGVY